MDAPMYPEEALLARLQHERYLKLAHEHYDAPDWAEPLANSVA